MIYLKQQLRPRLVFMSSCVCRSALRTRPRHFKDSWIRWRNTWRGVYVYLDDVLVASDSQEQHREHLRALFEALKRFGLVVNREKCVLSQRELEFLGHRVTSSGIRPLTEKVQAVKQYQQPRTVKSLQRFLGMLNFYRRFLPNIAQVLRPLTDALAGKPRQLVWTEQMTSSFRELRNGWRTQRCWRTYSAMLSCCCEQTPVRGQSRARCTRWWQEESSHWHTLVGVQQRQKHATVRMTSSS